MTHVLILLHTTSNTVRNHGSTDTSATSGIAPNSSRSSTRPAPATPPRNPATTATPSTATSAIAGMNAQFRFSAVAMFEYAAGCCVLISSATAAQSSFFAVVRRSISPGLSCTRCHSARVNVEAAWRRRP